MASWPCKRHRSTPSETCFGIANRAEPGQSSESGEYAGPHTPSTCERLRDGKLPCNRKRGEHWDVVRTTVVPGLEVVHAHGAGLDVGNATSYVGGAAEFGMHDHGSRRW